MRQSQLFTKTRREAPRDEVSKNAQLLIRAGYIHKEMAGVYDFLPLGLRTFEKVVGIIREEMNKIGGVELHLSALQDAEVWKKTDRWSDDKVDSWFKTKLKSGAEVGLGFTHEEPLTALMREYIASYKDLPTYPYQFQTKFRNEERAKSGLMRTREFVMKDLYSFSKDEAEHIVFYEKVKQAYINIFNRVGIGNKTYLTYASGGTFSKFSHEFQTVTDAGEDTVRIYVHKDDYGKGSEMNPAHVAINKEIYTDDLKKDLSLGDDFIEAKAIEVGNIFTLSTRFSEALGLIYKDESGIEVPVYMGSYGIGPARLMATVAELLSDEKGLAWSEAVAPFAVHLVEIGGDNDEVKKEATELYRELTEAGIDVLWDDRDLRAGEKFADSDLLGIPLRIVVSEKTLAAGKFECVHRASGLPAGRQGRTEHKSISELLGQLT